MTVTYTLDKDDFYKYNMYYVKHSPSGKRDYVKLRILVPVLWIALGIFVFIFGRSWLLALILAAASVLWFLFYEKIHFKTAERRIQDYLRRNEPTVFLGEYSIILGEDSLECRRPEDSLTLYYTSVSAPAFDPDNPCMYIFTSDISAYMIPFSAFADEDERNRFVEFLTEKVTAAKQAAKK